MSPHVSESKTVLESKSTPWIPDSRDILTVEFGFRIPFVCGIPDSLSCILDSEAQDLNTSSENFPNFGIPHAKIYSTIRIPLLLFRTQVPFIYHHAQLIIGLPVAQSKKELRLCRNLTKWRCVSYSHRNGGINF